MLRAPFSLNVHAIIDPVGAATRLSGNGYVRTLSRENVGDCTSAKAMTAVRSRTINRLRRHHSLRRGIFRRMADTTRGFQPYVPATQSMAEFTAKAIILGVLFGLLFGASTVYLGLRAGLTVSASIPIAVLAISVLKKLGGSTILENNT